MRVPLKGTLMQSANHPHVRPTVETRNALYTTAARLSEDARVQLRKHHSALLKKESVEKHSSDFATVRGSARCFTRGALICLRSIKPF